MKELLVNVSAGKERRLAIVTDGVLEELYIERESENSYVGNIYKGRVTNIEPSIQAAFIDFGGARNGFLHISDLQAQYFPKDKRIEEPVGRKASRKDRPSIQDCLRRGQELIVQVIKSGIGTKGPTLTTYLSVPGRFLVMMPGMTKFGVSRKIEDEDVRSELRGLIEQIEAPDDLGFIVRTAGLGRSKRDLQQDLKYLQRLWRSVQSRTKKHKAPAELYQESDLVIRTIRDVYSSEINRIICDAPQSAEKITDFLRVAMPRTPNKVMLYNGQAPLFYRYGLEEEIERIYSRRVEMPGGASLVIDQAEALVAIDVNSGKNRSNDDAEETAYRINLQAAKEVARQLRLRDMGGVIVIDFIDMRYERHQREVERVLREQVKSDRAKTKILKLSRFGLIEMTRQRMRPSLKRSLFAECSSCHGQGLIKSDESLSLSVIRSLKLACTDSRIEKIKLTVPRRIADYLNNALRKQVVLLEANSGKPISIVSDDTFAGDEIKIECYDQRGGLINWLPDPQDKKPMPSAPADAPVNMIRKPPADDELVDINEYDPELDDSDSDISTDIEKSIEAETPTASEATSYTQPQSSGDEQSDEQPQESKSRKRRRRRRRKKNSDSNHTDQQSQENAEAEADENSDQSKQSNKADQQQPSQSDSEKSDSDAQANEQSDKSEQDKDGEKKTRRRRRRGGRRRRSKQHATDAQHSSETSDAGDSQKTDESAKTPDTNQHQGRAENAQADEDRGSAQAERRDLDAQPSRQRDHSSENKSQRKTDTGADHADQQPAKAADESQPDARPAAKQSEGPANDARSDETQSAPAKKKRSSRGRGRRKSSKKAVAQSADTQQTEANSSAASKAQTAADSPAAPAQAAPPAAEQPQSEPAAKSSEGETSVAAKEPATAKTAKKKTAKKKKAKTAKKAKTTRKKAAAKSKSSDAEESSEAKPTAKTAKKTKTTRKKRKTSKAAKTAAAQEGQTDTASE